MAYDLKALKTDLRAGPYAWPGAYQRYFVAADGEALSFEAVRERFRSVCHDMTRGPKPYALQFRIVGCEIHWEGAPLICAHTGREIPSAYGDPDTDD